MRPLTALTGPKASVAATSAAGDLAPREPVETPRITAARCVRPVGTKGTFRAAMKLLWARPDRRGAGKCANGGRPRRGPRVRWRSCRASSCTGKGSERTRYRIAKPIMPIKARRADERGLSFDDRGAATSDSRGLDTGHLAADSFNVNDVVEPVDPVRKPIGQTVRRDTFGEFA